MKRFKLSPEAAEDIREIWAYIAADSIKAARHLRLQIFEACQRIADNPGIGHSREDLTEKPVLFWPTGSYLIIYIARKPVEIVRVLHGARDIPSLL
jgi:plasmid stabilization system protein ParE